MRVEYKSVIDEIMKQAEIAAFANRTITKVFLSDAEVIELKRELGPLRKTSGPGGTVEGCIGNVDGVPIFKELPHAD